MTNIRFSPRPNRANEIHWHDWNDEAFALASADDKPILLDISGVWCHWCHVMDETSYSDPAIIQIINEQFIAIRVETDQRPDVNRRYNMGGWPTTAFLTPDGDLLTGGTYIPPEQMRAYLIQVSEAYQNDKPELLRRIAEINVRRGAVPSAARTTTGKLSPRISESVLQAVRDNFDAPYGGFGDQPKFPHADVLELALEKYYQTRDESLLPIVTTTLTNMASGGMYDQQAGGFFRYSTTRDWSIPHFEKMLEDHGKLLALYAHAYQIRRLVPFLQTAETMIHYLNSTLSDPSKPGFYGSQDADEEYYGLSLAERAKRAAPFIDKTFYTDWNAMMVSAYFAIATLFLQWKGGEPDPRNLALGTLDRLWKDMFRAGAGIYHYQRENESPRLLNQLTDLAHSSLALLDAYQQTGEISHLERARVLCNLAIERNLDLGSGAFHSEPPAEDAQGLLRIPDQSLNENTAMARALVRLARLTDAENYRAAAEKALAFFAVDYEKYGFAAADYARVVDEVLIEPLHIKIVGAPDDPSTHELHVAALNEYAPAKLVQLFEPARDAAWISQMGFAADGVARAYVCAGTLCLEPTSDAATMQKQIAEINRNS